MKYARERFEENLPSLVQMSRSFWEDELPIHRGTIYSFNEALFKSTPRISIAIVSLIGRRFGSLLARIDELTNTTRRKDIEVIITIADPENISYEKWGILEKKFRSANFPIKVVLAKKNLIAMNRNLASSISSGKYRVFMDDDVQLVGPVIEALIRVLEEYPEIGMVSLPFCDQKLNMTRPRWHSLKYPVGKDLFVTNTVLGMVTATRSEIVKVIPFLPFLPMGGDDIFFVRQMHLLGFLGAYVIPEDAYGIDEELDYRGTRNPKVFTNFLIEEGLVYYFDPETYDYGQESLGVYKIYARGGNSTSIDNVAVFWRYFRVRLLEFLNSKEKYFNFNIDGYEMKWVIEKSYEIQEAVKFFEENKERIILFKDTSYLKKNLSGVNPFLGILRYQADNQQNQVIWRSL